MEITMTEKINNKVQEIWKTDLVPRGNIDQTLTAIASAIEHGNIDSNYFLDWREAETLARKIYKEEAYSTQLTDGEFQQIAKIAAMIPLNTEDEHNGEWVVGILLYSCVVSKNRVNAFFSFLPEDVQKADRAREDLEDMLDWVDFELNSVRDNLVFLSHDRAEEEIRDWLFLFDGEGIPFSEADVKALTEILSHLMIAERNIKRVADGLAHSYGNILSRFRAKKSPSPLSDEDREWWKTMLS